MMRKLGVAVLLAMACLPAVCAAQEAPQPGADGLREFCTERPGLTTPACTVDPGHLQVEMGAVSWERDGDASQRTDQITLGNVQLRYGLGPSSEVQLSWAPYVCTETRDLGAGDVRRANGIGDATIGFKQNFARPQDGGTRLSAGIVAYATLPVGTHQGGDGDWSAGAVVPLDYQLNDKVQLALSPRVEAAVDDDRSGRHLAFGASAGVEFDVTDAISLSPEIEVMRDLDPAQSATISNAALSIAWKSGERTQLDMQCIAGLNAAAPDIQLAFGISHEF